MSCAVICSWNPGRTGSTNHCHFFSLTCLCLNVDVNGKDHTKQWELITGLQHFARNVFCSGHSGGTANHLESKCAYLKPLLLLFNERVITYMKTVVWKSSVCTAEQLRYTVGNWALLWVSVCEPKLQQHQGSSQALMGSGVQEVRGGGHRRNQSGLHGRNAELFALWATIRKSYFCLYWGIILALWPFKTPCSL